MPPSNAACISLLRLDSVAFQPFGSLGWISETFILFWWTKAQGIKIVKPTTLPSLSLSSNGTSSLEAMLKVSDRNVNNVSNILDNPHYI